MVRVSLVKVADETENPVRSLNNAQTLFGEYHPNLASRVHDTQPQDYPTWVSAAGLLDVGENYSLIFPFLSSSRSGPLKNTGKDRSLFS